MKCKQFSIPRAERKGFEGLQRATDVGGNAFFASAGLKRNEVSELSLSFFFENFVSLCANLRF